MIVYDEMVQIMTNKLDPTIGEIFDFFKKRRLAADTDPAVITQREQHRKDLEEKERISKLSFGASNPDPNGSDEFGWRIWIWDEEIQLLRSPQQKTIWHTPELIIDDWTFEGACRGNKGIHAARVPRNWEYAQIDKNRELTSVKPYVPKLNRKQLYMLAKANKSIPKPDIIVDGIVERMGKFVVGSTGWRTEWAIIRKLRAPNAEIGHKLEKAYPELEGEVYYGHRKD